jgi:hypothetical protein
LAFSCFRFNADNRSASGQSRCVSDAIGEHPQSAFDDLPDPSRLIISGNSSDPLEKKNKSE